METAILLGIPSPYVARLRSAVDSHNEFPHEWSLKFVPTPKKSPEVNRATARQAGRLAGENTSSHILGFVDSAESIGMDGRAWTVLSIPLVRSAC